MSKKYRKIQEIESESMADYSMPVNEAEQEPVENKLTENKLIWWPNFDAFWNECVSGGSQLVKEAAIVHLKSIGSWDDQSKWIDSLKHFGIKTEK